MKDSLEKEKMLSGTPGYWKVLGISLVYAAALATSAFVADAVMSIPGEPSWIEVAVGIVVWASPIVVLIWGAVIASRVIRRKTNYPSSPDGLILMLFATGISAFLISLAFEIHAQYFVIVSLPFVVWVYLAILQRRFGRLGSPADPA